ncbi:MAG: DUF1540 domain-containing protein [Peptostreptococcaceae bacterium]
MSNNLNCSASNCAYNNDCKCQAGAISVCGNCATTTSQTNCTSFVDKANSAFTNCANCTCTKTDHIKCSADTCVYNQNSSCKAGNVQINANTASCETFKYR